VNNLRAVTVFGFWEWLCSNFSRTLHNSPIEIDRYGFFDADTDISAIHGPITDISKIFKSCFWLHYQKYCVYSMPYLSFKNFKNQDL